MRETRGSSSYASVFLNAAVESKLGRLIATWYRRLNSYRSDACGRDEATVIKLGAYAKKGVAEPKILQRDVLLTSKASVYAD
jgi:hypothetical protein